MNKILIVALGNPGDRYTNTRHNIGWMVLDKFVQKHEIEIKPESNIYYAGYAKYAGKNIILCYPTTYMNNSGEAVIKIASKYGIPISNIIVIVDEYQFPLGKIHFRNGGSHSGHNGIASVMEELNSANFYRLRMGIDKNFPQGGMVDYVLSPFREDELPQLEIALNKGVDALEYIIKSGISRAMSFINSGELWNENVKPKRKIHPMDNFIYQNPTKIIFGKNTINNIGSEIAKHNIKKVLILAGGGSIKKNGAYDEMIASLKAQNIESVEKWGVVANPVLSHAREAIALCREHELEAIIAIGGGSVIDEAKAIAVGTFADDVWNIYEGKEKVKNALPIFVILTISATASEMNANSVLTNAEEKKKWAFGSPLCYPKVSIIDPDKQMTLPWNQTVNGAIDAISHIMENYFAARNGQTVTLGYNESLIKSIVEVTDGLKQDEKDYNLRANLAWAATMALNGYTSIGIAGGEWTTHKIEHAISALYPHIAHGEGLAVVFPAWIKYMQKYNQPTFDRWAKNAWNANSVDEACDKMKAKFKEWGSPISLRDLNIPEEAINAIADNVMMVSKFGLLKKYTKEDIVNILELAK